MGDRADAIKNPDHFRYYGKGTILPSTSCPISHRLGCMEIPSVYGYNDFRQFLADWQTALQEADPALHKSEISKRLGLPRTRSYFTDVLNGKKVSSVFLERFVEVLGLSKEETKFFRALVNFNQATGPEEREAAFDLLVSLNRSPRQLVAKPQYQYYRNWWTGALRALLSVEDHGDDWATLARSLRPEITPGQAKSSVRLMEELELLEKRDGFWKPTALALSTGDDIQDELVLQLQMQQFELARLATMTRLELPKDISTNTLSVSATAFEQIRRRIAAFRSEVRSIVHKDDHPADRVYELCLALFPLTRKPAR